MNNNTQRYEVVAPMPHFTHLFKGDILVPKQHPLYTNGGVWGIEDEDNVSKWITFCPDFPHLFRLLKWWEGLAFDELPICVKSKTTKFVAKVEYKNVGVLVYVKNTRFDEWHALASYSEGIEPATEAEYQEYLTKLNL
jgi:hypothetical protein